MEQKTGPTDVYWTQEEDRILRENQDLGSLTWNEIAECLPGRSVAACRMRFNNYLKNGQTKASTHWTSEDDSILCEQQELTWNQTAGFFLKSRTGNNACQERFSDLKNGQAAQVSRRTPWTVEEDEILREQRGLGDLTWDQIASKFLPGRSGPLADCDSTT
jgi:hypothetical protein